jgi:hypothetical protein
MILIDRLSETQFMDANISNDDIVLFFEDHVSRLEADNVGGNKNAMLALVEPQLALLIASIGKRETDEATKVGKSLTKNQSMGNIKVAARLAYKLVTFTSGTSSETTLAFFPSMLKDINKMSLKTVKPILTRLMNASTTYASTFPTLLGIFTALNTQYGNARSAQTTDMGIVNADSPATNALRLTLCEIGTDNLCYLGIMYRLTPGKAATFFDQSIITPVDHHTYDTIDGTSIPGAITFVKEVLATEDTRVQLRSKTAGVKFSVAILVNKTDPFVKFKSVKALKAYTWSAFTLGGNTGTNIMVRSDSLTDDGDWEIVIIDE